MLRTLIYYVTYPFRTIVSSPSAVFSAPRRLLGMSLPMRVAVLVTVFLLTCTVLSYTIFYFSENRAGYEQWFTLKRIVLIVVLLIAIPIVVYHTIKVWLEGEESEFPDIDYAWKEGVAALEQHGLDLLNVPVYLILGVRDSKHAKALVDASGLDLRVHEVPEGPAALHWFANPNAILLFCSETCLLSRLTQATAVDDLRTTPVPANPGQGSAIFSGTASFDVDAPGTAARAEALAPASEPGASQPFTGTMRFGTDSMSDPLQQLESTGTATRTVRLTPDDVSKATARLEYVCQLLKKARQPLCPMNGVLTVLPFDLVRRSDEQGIEVQRVVRRDLDTLVHHLKLRCQVIALVGDMEMESGFRELVRRVGRKRSEAQRFGKGFNVWNAPIPEQIEAATTHACGAFEDWVYALFREKDGFHKTGNAKLYSLLCRMRGRLKTRLTNILVDAYAHEDRSGQHPDALLFSGIYFAATGETGDRQAFVRSVFERLLEQENELDWTQNALEEDEHYQRVANVLTAVNATLLVAIGGMLVYRYLLSP